MIKTASRWLRLFAALMVLTGAAACASLDSAEPLDFPVDGDGKTDTFGRRLAGIASDYEAADLDESVLAADMRARREAAWATVFKVLEPVPLLGLADSAANNEDIVLPEGEVPKVPRFQTWYGIDDIKRMFQRLYGALGPNERAVRAAFSAEALEDAVEWNATALDRSTRWPLERYLSYVRALGLCPESMSDDDCARLVQQQFGGGVSGNPRILYSPAVVDHVLRNYRSVLACIDELNTLGLAAGPRSETNFSTCFDAEFPVNGALIKAQWERADFGRTVPTFDTGADALGPLLASTAHWGDDGDRRTNPTPSDILTIRLRNGDTYRMVGLHIMTKEIRHWQWITLWWSDDADTDFGADRPQMIRDGLDPVFQNYKMCVVDSFEEGDPDAPGRFQDAPSLAAALRAVDAGAGGPTWCSNPYLEHGRNNARTNCIGCHQHGGSTVLADANNDGALDEFTVEAIINDETNYPNTGRSRVRDVFPADYLFSMNRVDDFAQMMRSEVNFFDAADFDSVRIRVNAVLALDGLASSGATWFAANCAGCHGSTGEGSSFAPSLYTRVPNRDDESLVQTLIQGRGGMPAWGNTFNDQQLADLRAYLRATFGGG